MRKFLKAIPTGITSLLALTLLSYLSLAPDPFDMNEEALLFAGADKLVHILMYVGTTLAFLFDYAKHRLPHHTKINIELALTATVMVIGVVMEILQLVMRLGRNFDFSDIVANCIGAALAMAAAHLWLIPRFRHSMLRHHHHHHHHRPASEKQ